MPLSPSSLDGLSDAHLVAVVLGPSRDPQPPLVVSTALLVELGGLAGLSRCDVGALAHVGVRRAVRLVAAMELGRRAIASSLERAPLTDAGVVGEWGRAKLSHLDHEELWMLAIDGQRGLRAARCVARGGLHGLQLHVRDPLRVALREGASAIVLVHNHPSGDPTPSPQDVEFTVRFAAACELVGTPLVDHVIVGGDRHASMLALGCLERAPPRGRAQNSAS